MCARAYFWFYTDAGQLFLGIDDCLGRDERLYDVFVEPGDEFISDEFIAWLKKYVKQALIPPQTIVYAQEQLTGICIKPEICSSALLTGSSTFYALQHVLKRLIFMMRLSSVSPVFVCLA